MTDRPAAEAQFWGHVPDGGCREAIDLLLSTLFDAQLTGLIERLEELESENNSNQKAA